MGQKQCNTIDYIQFAALQAPQNRDVLDSHCSEWHVHPIPLRLVVEKLWRQSLVASRVELPVSKDRQASLDERYGAGKLTDTRQGCFQAFRARNIPRRRYILHRSKRVEMTGPRLPGGSITQYSNHSVQ